jgi:C-5 cytosine-specific DNA methylase
VPCHVFVNTGDLTKGSLDTDVGEHLRHLPPHKFTLFAIECDDISSCSTTPRSVMDPAGKSGSSFLEFMAYLKSMEFHQRPLALMVECVKNLNHVRKQLNDEKGTDVVSQALAEIGYVGSWQTLHSQDFYVPQSRRRIYGVFLKLTKGFGSHGSLARDADVNKVWQFVKRSATKPHFYKLDALLSSLCAAGVATPTGNCKRQVRRKSTRQKKQPPLWVQRHSKVKTQMGLTEADVDFQCLHNFKSKAVELGLTEREVDASISVLGYMMKTDELDDWQSELLVANIGDSIDRLRFKRNIFPCLLPDQKYLLLNKGELTLNQDPRLFTALQGIGHQEVQHFGLQNLTLSHAQDLAGNAFTANICASVLLALMQFA